MSLSVLPWKYIFIQPTIECADTLESYITDDELVDTMVYDMLEEMEWKNGKICDESDSRYPEEHEIKDDT